MQAELGTFSQEIDSRSNQIPKLLDGFKSRILEQNQISQKSNQNEVEKAAAQAIQQIKTQIENWKKIADQNHEAQEFIRENEKYLVVMVFGAVKAGKSSLGNFFAGKGWLDAKFDNPYKHLPRPKFVTKTSGRATGGIQKDESGNDWFVVDVTDATGAIQYFTLNGLRWIDSPGTEAVAKSGDVEDMTELVKRFVSYTDMAIFLLNSSEPGLRSDFEYMKNLDREEQESLVVITKSDQWDEDWDDDAGDVIKILTPKNHETRSMQENSICERLKEWNPEIDASKFHAISVSTLLAEESLKKNDDDKFHSSGLDEFIRRLGNKITDRAIELKRQNQLRLISKYIDELIDSLNPIESATNTIQSEAEKYKSQIETRARSIARRVSNSVKREIDSRSYGWNQQVRQGGSLDKSMVNSEITEILNDVLSDAINESIGEIIQNYQARQISISDANLEVGDLSNQTKLITTTRTEYYQAKRDARGFWENVKSFFGADFYETRSRNVNEYHKIDLGTNIDEFLDDLFPKVEAFAMDQATRALNILRDEYFFEQENFASAISIEVNDLRMKLSALKKS